MDNENAPEPNTPDTFDPDDTQPFEPVEPAEAAETEVARHSNMGAPSETPWDTDEALESLKMERSVHDSETDDEMAKRIIKQSAPAAAQAIIHIALHDSNGRTRLAASQYLLDRTLGKPGQDPDFATGKDPITEALERINQLAIDQGSPAVPQE